MDLRQRIINLFFHRDYSFSEPDLHDYAVDWHLLRHEVVLYDLPFSPAAHSEPDAFRDRACRLALKFHSRVDRHDPGDLVRLPYFLYCLVHPPPMRRRPFRFPYEI